MVCATRDIDFGFISTEMHPIWKGVIKGDEYPVNVSPPTYICLLSWNETDASYHVLRNKFDAVLWYLPMILRSIQ